MKSLSSIWRRLLARFRGRYLVCRVADLPEPLHHRRLYLVGEEKHLWFAAMLCPDGCAAVLHLSLLEEDDPRWRVTVHPDETATLAPSVWRTQGCRSHFFLKKGEVLWVS